MRLIRLKRKMLYSLVIIYKYLKINFNNKVMASSFYYPLTIKNREIIKGEVKVITRDVKLISDDNYNVDEKYLFNPIKNDENEISMGPHLCYLLILSSIVMFTTTIILHQIIYYLISLNKEI